MHNYQEINVLKETRRNASMAVNAIDALMGKVYNQEFAYELASQKNRFQEFERKAEAGLWQHGLMARKAILDKAMLWGAIQANTMLNISTPHVADMMIQGNTRGIAELMKVKHNNKNTGSFANELAEELMDFEEENIERLKRFL
ncbi:MAG: hypothetical protein HFH42_05280 [Lachnospiraceae bacterium]|jgi:hypothetical protein|nr:hypothetical protein [Lachnospiraceae bacterium]